jgi:hypothetical protein
MPTPKPSLPPRYQFGLRSLLLLTLFVAILCSLGVCTHWLVSAAIALPVVIGGIAGWIVAGTGEGLVQGIIFGYLFLLGDILVCGGFLYAIPRVAAASWQLFSVFHVILVLIGGVLGGLLERLRQLQR